MHHIKHSRPINLTPLPPLINRPSPPLPEPHTGADAHFMEDLASG